MSGLYSVKPSFVRALSGIEDRLVARGVGPDALSWWAVGAGGAAGAALVAGHAVAPSFWLLVAPLIVVRLALNALDGSVARRSGKGRPFGKVINEVSDRVCDVLSIAPLIVIAPPLLVLSVIVTASLVSLCGSLGEVVGSARLTQGPMGKADRCAVLAVAATVAGLTGARTAFTVALVVILVGGLATVLGRWRSLRELAEASEVTDVR